MGLLPHEKDLIRAQLRDVGSLLTSIRAALMSEDAVGYQMAESLTQRYLETERALLRRLEG